MTSKDVEKILPNADDRRPVKDRGYAWVILAASLVTLTINWGLVLCFGIYFVTLLDHFQCSKRDVATVGALAYGVLCFTGPLVTYLETRVGARVLVMSGSVLASLGMIVTYFAQRLWHVYIGFGLIGGFGFSFMYIPCFAILPRYFDRYQHFATSFATVGSAVGNLLFSNILYYVIDRFTWRGSMLINAAFILQCAVCGALMRENETPDRRLLSDGSWTRMYDGLSKKLKDVRTSLRDQQQFDLRRHKIGSAADGHNGDEQRDDGGSTAKNLFKEMKYLMFLIECFCYGGSSYVVFSFINDLIMEHGLSVGDSAALVSIIGALNIFGRVAASVVTHFQCTDRPLFFALATAFFTLSIFTTTLCYDFTSFALSLAVFGLTYGVKTSQIAAVLIDLFGIDRMATGMAYGVLCSGLGGFIVPPLAGWLADELSIESSFLLAAAFSCVALGSCVTIVFLHRHQVRKAVDTPTDSNTDANDTEKLTGDRGECP